MLSHFADASAIALLLVVGVPFGLAYPAAFRGLLVRPVRWLALGLAALFALF